MSGDIWDGVDRRAASSPPPAGKDEVMWKYIAEQFELLNAKMNAMHIDMVGHKADIHHIQLDVDSIKKSFPKDDEGQRDYTGHHDFHGGMIERSKKWGDIGNDVLKKLFGGIAWVTVCFIAYSIWESIKQEVKK